VRWYSGRKGLQQIRRIAAQNERTHRAVLTPAVSQIHSHRQTISIGAKRVSPAIFFAVPRHHSCIQGCSPGQLSQHLSHHFLCISLHWTSRFRPLQGWFTPLRRLAMLLQGSISLFYSLIAPLSAWITASLSPSVIGNRPSHLIWFRKLSRLVSQMVSRLSAGLRGIGTGDFVTFTYP
jgi:hypothetical protein